MKRLTLAGVCMRLAGAWLVAIAAMAGLLIPKLTPPPGGLKINAWFLYRQDLPVLWPIALASLGVLLVALASRTPAGAAARSTPDSGVDSPGAAMAIAIAVAAGVIAVAGTFLVMNDYPLSMDEFMADFDARILAHGRLMAPVDPAWRGWLAALQPQFVTLAPGNAAWSSQYLPVNAALRAAGLIVHAPWLVSPVLAGVSVLALYAVGRRLAPERPHLALIACVLMVSSSQFLITAMTPYAMTSHLAFNLIWLAVHLRGGWRGHASAILIGFLACGLHQFIFHPLFAAPFVLELAIARRWRLAAVYAGAYGAILAFWIAYPQIALAVSGASPAVGGATTAAARDLFDRVGPLLAAFGAASVRQLDENLIRFATWQNFALTPLMTLGLWPALRAGGPWRALAIGLILTVATMFLIMPYQGHGWGWRYVHGLLGSAALIAALSFVRLTDRLDAAGRRGAGWVLASLTAVSLLVLLPLRALQTHAFVRPYARASWAIRNARAPVVIVSPKGAWFADDLVRNDPFLRRAPVMLNALALTDEELQAWCASGKTAPFTAGDARRFGVRATQHPGPPRGC